MCCERPQPKTPSYKPRETAAVHDLKCAVSVHLFPSTGETVEGCSSYKINIMNHQEQPAIVRPALVQILSHLLKIRCQFVHYLGSFGR